MKKRKYVSLRKTYAVYKKRYAQQERSLRSRGYEMYDEQVNYTDFKTFYKDMKKELKERGIKNPNVNQYLVRKQSFEYSWKQARDIYDNWADINQAVETQGAESMDKPSMDEIRTSYKELTDTFIVPQYQTIRDGYIDDGYSFRDAVLMAKAQINQDYGIWGDSK